MKITNQALKHNVICILIGVLCLLTTWDFKSGITRQRPDNKNKKKPSYTVIKLNTFLLAKRKNSGTVIYDVRNEAAYNAGHIPDAIRLPDDTEEAISIIFQQCQKGMRPILYGVWDDSRTKKLAEALQEKHSEKVLIYSDGWNEWQSCGLPVILNSTS